MIEPTRNSEETVRPSPRAQKIYWLATLMAQTIALYPHHRLTAVEAEAFQAEWLALLEEVGEVQFAEALTAAVRSSEFFPSVARLRECAGAALAQRSKAESDLAWEFVIGFLDRHGPQGTSHFERSQPEGEHCALCDNMRWLRTAAGAVRCHSCGAGRHIPAPEIPSRIAYAIRSVNGLLAIEQAREDLKHLAFVRKEFVEAYGRAPLAATLFLPGSGPWKQVCEQVKEWLAQSSSGNKSLAS